MQCVLGSPFWHECNAGKPKIPSAKDTSAQYGNTTNASIASNGVKPGLTTKRPASPADHNNGAQKHVRVDLIQDFKPLVNASLQAEYSE